MKMHDDELDIDEALVKRLLVEQFPQWANLPIHAVESSGTSNAIYRLGEDMSVRLPSIPSAVKHVDPEYEWLPKLAPELPLPIAVPIAKGKPSDTYPWSWSICQWVDGQNPLEGQLDNPDGLSEDLAGFITALHRIDLPGGPASKRGVPLASQDESARKGIASLQGKIDTNNVTRIWEHALTIPQWDGPPVWLHGDLMPGNLLVKDGRLSAVIDFGCMGMGDPAIDVIPAWYLLPESAREGFRKALQVDDATWERGRGWALYMALLQLPYYEHTNPVMAANARYVFREILAEFSRV